MWVLGLAAAINDHMVFGGTRRGQAMSAGSDLNEQPRVGLLKTKIHRDIRHPRVADRGDLDRAPIPEHRERRDHAGVWEVDVRHVVAGLVQGDAELERNRLQVWEHAFVVRRRESREDAVRDDAARA